MKRRAGSALRQAGRRYLADLGLRPASSGPRQWVSDHGWWLVNVEFQASAWSVGSYLNVDVQYLWTTADRRNFGHGNPRYAIPGCGQFASLEGAEDQLLSNADSVGRAARAAVLARTDHLRDDEAHLSWLSQQADTGLWQRFDAGVATGVLGLAKQAAGIFEEIQAGLDLGTAWQQELAHDCQYLAGLALDVGAIQSEIDARITQTRQNVNLPPREPSKPLGFW